MADLRKILFSRCASPEAELGKAMLTAWNLRPDAPPSAGKNFEEFRENLRRIREQVLQGPPDRDRKIFVQYLDTSISFCPDEAVAAEPGEA